MRHPRPHIALLAGLVLVTVLAACSTKKNTASSRWWQSFVTRYNVYFNGHEAYKEGCLTKENSNKDNFTEMLPLFVVGNESSRTIGASNFETAVTKCEKAIQLHSIKRKPAVSPNRRRSPKLRAYLSRKEFNPFLKNAWMLMGKAQFQKGDFLEAASTFSYITRLYAPEPDVAAEARVWLARCYAELEWFYDAEDVISRLRRDTVPPRLNRELDATMADLLLRQEQLAEALPYLERTVKAEKRNKQQARGYYLLGQVYTQLGRPADAYKAYQRCLRQSPPYELAFNARIQQTEVLTTKANAKKMISRLRRMARSDNNKDYLDQVYYAMGNIHLTLRDTAAAIGAYEKGRKESTRGGIEKGVLLLRLAGLRWERKEYDKAQACYAEAIGLLDKEHEEYDLITRRSKVLDALVPYTSAVHLQDSLQELARMPEADRLAAIDRVIEELKRQEEEARRAKADSAAEARAQKGGGAGGTLAGNRPGTAGTSGNDEWYFYNPMVVSQGKQAFQRQWGRRTLEDNWRRSNRTVLASLDDGGVDYEAEDSIRLAEERADSIAEAMEAVADSAQNDPHQREYYLKQIPFTPEAVAASNEIIKDGLYHAGLIEKDQLEDFPLAAATLERLVRDFPDFQPMDDVYYNLFLLYSRWNKPVEAAGWRARLADEYPKSDLAVLVTDPDFERNARYGREIEDSLYTVAYDAYRRGDDERVIHLADSTAQRFPTGLNRPKFLFLRALTGLRRGVDAQSLATELKELVRKYPESDVSEMAGLIVKGIEEGRQLGTGAFDIGSIWARRTAGQTAAADSAAQARELSADRDAAFVYMLAFPTDSVDADQLLFDLSRFNFGRFVVRNFDVERVSQPGMEQFRIHGFNGFDEAHTYAQQVYADSTLRPVVRRARVVIISEDNLQLLGATYSFDDYAKFYEEKFAPLEIKPELYLDANGQEIRQIYEDELPGDYREEEVEDAPVEDGGEWYSE